MSPTSIGRRYWARRMIDKARGAEIPTYGTTAWSVLPEGSAERIAAVVIAAECWAQAADSLEEDLRREVDGRRRAEKCVEDEAYFARMVEHRSRWRHLSVVEPRYVGQEVRPLEDIGADAR